MSQPNILSTSELIINSTIRIECYGDTILNGNKVPFTSTGTGFFFEFLIDSMRVPVIVTNYHVIQNTHSGILNFTENDKNDIPKYGSIISEKIMDFDKKWIRHPNVDLAILPINPVIENLYKTKNIILFTTSFSEDLLPTKNLLDELTAIEEVLMIGYPKGLWDKTNNLPIVRKGITATPVYINYEGRKQFLLDIPNFAGSSGSPVVLYNHGSYSTKKGGIVIGSRIALLGINVQSYDYGAKGQVVSPPNDPLIQTSTKIPLNIAIIIKSEELLDFKPILKSLINPGHK